MSISFVSLSGSTILEKEVSALSSIFLETRLLDWLQSERPDICNGKIILVDENGTRLPARFTVSDVEVPAIITVVHTLYPRLYSTAHAFCAVGTGGQIVSWGEHHFSSQAEVREVFTTQNAFAALTESGNVCAWGDPRSGGDTKHVYNAESEPVRELDDSLLLNSGLIITNVCATYHAFLALTSDGRIFTWGYEEFGANNQEAEEYLSNHKVIHALASVGAFFAFVDIPNRLVVWSKSDFLIFDDVVSAHPQLGPFVDEAILLKTDGTVRMSLNIRRTKCEIVPGDESDIVEIYAGMYAFLGIRANGEPIGWGQRRLGGEIPEYARQKLKNSKIKKVECTWGTFVVLLQNGTVVTWGSEDHGGSPNESITDQLCNDIVDVIADKRDRGGVVALSRSGRVIHWGMASAKWIDPPSWLFDTCVEGVATDCSGGWVAWNQSGILCTWGRDTTRDLITEMNDWELDATTRKALFDKRIVTVVGTRGRGRVGAFACLCDDDTIVSWGSPTILKPGGCSAVQI